MNMVNISRETYEKNDTETKIGNNGILRLNEKHIKKKA